MQISDHDPGVWHGHWVDELLPVKLKIGTAAAPDSNVLESDLPVFQHSRFPIWVFDIDQSRVIWANTAALGLWEAPDLSELSQRDMGSEMSSSVRERLAFYQKRFAEGDVFDESCTLFPAGEPKPVMCRFRGCLRHDGTYAMLCEAHEITVDSPEVLRGSQALLYTGAMVSIYDEAGQCVYANPAAARVFGDDVGNLQDRVLNAFVREALLEVLKGEREGRYVSEVRTEMGERIHEIEARRSIDAVTGRRSLLLTEQDITEAVRVRQAVDKLANQDMLTGLYNRNFLTTYTEAFVAAAREAGQDVFLLMLDLDRFKMVNDTLGHAVGDRLLGEVADRMRDFFTGDEVLCRLGGDEFCILIRTRDRPEMIENLASIFVERLRKPLQIDGYELRIDTSLGMVRQPVDAGQVDSLDQMLQKADLALYDAKGRGGGQVRLFHPALLERQARLSYVEGALMRALEGRDGARLEMTYQPQVCLRRGVITGAEALARLHTDDGVTLGPDEFVAVAETTGLIRALGAQVLEHVAAAVRALPPSLSSYRLSVNVSAVQLHDDSLLTQLTEIAGRPGDLTRRIELELTETQPALEGGRFGDTLRRVADLGFRIAIDDFGTGYSNVAQLGLQPINRLKMDRSLIRRTENRTLARGVINMSHAMNIPVMAEGVETLDQRDWLIAEGCHAQQGFLYGKPMDFEAFCALDATDIAALEGGRGAQ